MLSALGIPILSRISAKYGAENLRYAVTPITSTRAKDYWDTHGGGR